ncbi:zinc-binding protein [Phycisphaerae bacterium RAS1]|nr:zinc-binding protein [Phycisphaerae bacterium RAS1]
MPAYECAICRRRRDYPANLPDVYPFCSERCRMVDLGLWFREAYTINRELTPEEAGEMGTGDGESAGGSKCD